MSRKFPEPSGTAAVIGRFNWDSPISSVSHGKVIHDADGGAFVWDGGEWKPTLLPTLPGESTIGPSPGSGVDLHTGRMAAFLTNFDDASPPTTHPQARIRFNGVDVLVDREIAPLISGLNEIGIGTVTSCQGGGRLSSFVMLDSPASASRFLRMWHAHLVPAGHPLPKLEFELRDAAWRDEVGQDYPSARTIPMDRAGFGYTATWRLDPERLHRLLPNLLAAIAEGPSSRKIGSESV